MHSGSKKSAVYLLYSNITRYFLLSFLSCIKHCVVIVNAAVLVYKCLYQAALTYLAQLCSSVSESASRGHLRSAAQGDLALAVPRSRTMRYRHRCFAVSGPTLWNSLPLTIHDPSLTLTQFCARLKTVLFCRAYKTLA